MCNTVEIYDAHLSKDKSNAAFVHLKEAGFPLQEDPNGNAVVRTEGWNRQKFQALFTELNKKGLLSIVRAPEPQKCILRAISHCLDGTSVSDIQAMRDMRSASSLLRKEGLAHVAPDVLARMQAALPKLQSRDFSKEIMNVSPELSQKIAQAATLTAHRFAALIRQKIDEIDAKEQ